RLNVNGKQVQLGDEGSKLFLSGVLTPNETHAFDLQGPDLDATFQEATLDFQLFDVPVEQNAAGEVQDKQPFKWTFKAKLTPKDLKVEKKTETVSLAAGEASAMGCPVGSA